MYGVVNYKEVGKIADKSRAEYFRERRKAMKQFTVMIKREKLEAFEEHLKDKGVSKVSWFEGKVDEEIGEKK